MVIKAGINRIEAKRPVSLHTEQNKLRYKPATMTKRS